MTTTPSSVRRHLCRLRHRLPPSHHPPRRHLGLDPHDPAHQLIAQRLATTWADKLRRHATLTLPTDHNPSTDSRTDTNPNPTT